MTPIHRHLCGVWAVVAVAVAVTVAVAIVAA